VTLQNRIVFWGFLALGAGIGVWILRDVLLPFVAAMFLAYMLNPVANRLEKLGMSRAIATLLILVVFLLVFVALLLILIPLLASQLGAFVRALPGYVTRLQDFAQTALGDAPDNPISAYIVQRLTAARQDFGAVIAESASWIGAFLTRVLAGGQAVVQVLGLLVLTPIIAFYILVDWPKMLAKLDSWLPLTQAHVLRELARETDKALAAFIRGQASVCLALAIFYGISLTALGLNFGLLIGVSAGLISFVPYVGTIVGLFTAVGVALVQFLPDYTMLMIVVGIFAAGQILDGYVLQPKLVGNSVGLHPVWLMFALFAFGSLFGFVGLLIAVPVAATIGVFLRYGIRRYLASPLYTGQPIRQVRNETEPPG